ncbi:hypothetical protein EVC30_095 [Rhizobium phage RHph_Y1_11]|nr:hypothetical protein EVC30_095 [Rhizobium phage RHph_Y1_11]
MTEKPKYVIVVSVSKDDTMYWVIPKDKYDEYRNDPEEHYADLFAFVAQGDSENGGPFSSFYTWWEVLREVKDGSIEDVLGAIAY